MLVYFLSNGQTITVTAKITAFSRACVCVCVWAVPCHSHWLLLQGSSFSVCPVLSFSLPGSRAAASPRRRSWRVEVAFAALCPRFLPSPISRGGEGSNKTVMTEWRVSENQYETINNGHNQRAAANRPSLLQNCSLQCSALFLWFALI